MFYVIRFGCLFLLIIILFILYRISRIRINKYISFLSMGLILLAMFISIIFPAEDYILHFDTIESVFQYRYSGTLEGTIEGKNSCLLLYNTGASTSTIAFIAKEEDSYQIGNWFAKSTIYTGTWEGYSFKIYRYDEKDYYIMVSGFTKNYENFQLNDEYNSTFTDFSQGSNVNGYIRYIAYVPNLNENNYAVTINGTTVKIL